MVTESVDELEARAQAAEALAAMVSYRPDKERLLGQAAELRRAAQEAAGREPRSFKER